MKKVVGFMSLGVILVLLVTAFLAYTHKPKLSKLHDTIESTYRNVAHIDAAVLNQLDQQSLVFFDVREPVEYDVSHIKKAIQLSPSISPQEFAQHHADLLANKTIVFYCSVGKRSSELASRMQQVIADHNGKNSYNLIGGIFQWRNDARPLVDKNGATTKKVHPYNKYWARYINKRAISYTPSD